MVWYSHLLKNFPLFVVIDTVKDFGIINKADVDIFLELCCFFCDPADVGNLISGSSTFSKPSLNIWKFMVHVLLNPVLENFELSHKKNEIMPSAATCMDLEIIILSEINWTEKDKYHIERVTS